MTPPSSRPRRRATRRWLVAAAVAAACAAPASAGAYVKSDLPDLVPMLPTFVSAGQAAPAYVDALERPGRVLYRFDGVIWNRSGAGALDVYREPATGHVMQAVWRGGLPTSTPVPDAPPPSSDPNWTAVDRSAAGASFYLQGGTWHWASAALYSLIVPGGPPRISDKVGFCFFDTWGGGATPYFSSDNPSPYGSYWCHQPQDGTATVRMGVSPGLGDYYWSQLMYQWVDVTDLPPGPYTLRAQVNPGGMVLESDISNDTLEDVRTIPGPTADSGSDPVAAGTAGPIALSGGIVAPGIPARASNQGACADDIPPTVPLSQCYVTTTADGPLTFAVLRAPAHGTVQLRQAGAQGATATYTPAAGYSGPDSFTYRTTDARGLVSRPATISLDVLPASSSGPGGGGGGTGGTGPRALRVSLRTVGTVRVGKVVRLRVTLSRPVRLRVTLQVRSGRRYRNVTTRVVTRAHPLVAFRPTRRGRYLLRVRYTVRGRVVYSPRMTLRLVG